MGGSGGVLKVLEGIMGVFGGCGENPQSLYGVSYGVRGFLRSWKGDMGVVGEFGWGNGGNPRIFMGILMGWEAFWGCS